MAGKKKTKEPSLEVNIDDDIALPTEDTAVELSADNIDLSNTQIQMNTDDLEAIGKGEIVGDLISITNTTDAELIERINVFIEHHKHNGSLLKAEKLRKLKLSLMGGDFHISHFVEFYNEIAREKMELNDLEFDLLRQFVALGLIKQVKE